MPRSPFPLPGATGNHSHTYGNQCRVQTTSLERWQLGPVLIRVFVVITLHGRRLRDWRLSCSCHKNPLRETDVFSQAQQEMEGFKWSTSLPCCPLTGSRMGLLIDSLQSGCTHVRIDLGGHQTLVSQEFLNTANVGTPIKQVGGKTMSERVGRST